LLLESRTNAYLCNSHPQENHTMSIALVSDSAGLIDSETCKRFAPEGLDVSTRKYTHC
jgi:hypothetical protein